VGSGALEPRRIAASRRRYGELAIKGVLFLCATVSILTTVGIVVALAGPTIDFFQEVSLGEYFTGTSWAPLFSPSSF
jgi:phosphate transport system permease protein